MVSSKAQCLSRMHKTLTWDFFMAVQKSVNELCYMGHDVTYTMAYAGFAHSGLIPSLQLNFVFEGQHRVLNSLNEHLSDLENKKSARPRPKL